MGYMGSYYIPKAIFYLLKGDYSHLRFEGLGTRGLGPGPRALGLWVYRGLLQGHGFWGFGVLGIEVCHRPALCFQAYAGVAGIMRVFLKHGIRNILRSSCSSLE